MNDALEPSCPECDRDIPMYTGYLRHSSGWTFRVEFADLECGHRTGEVSLALTLPVALLVWVTNRRAVALARFD